MESNTDITIERDGHLLMIGVNRPTKKNSFTPDMLNTLGRAYAELENDDDLRCGVLFAHGSNFTAGLDLTLFAERFAEGRLLDAEGGIDPFRLSEPYLTKPVVTAIQGLCLTAGIELMLATDVRIASQEARFAQIEVQRGFFAAGGATIRFVQEAGWGNAMRWLLTGDEFSAAEALRIGFVQEVVETGRQLERAVEIARVIADRAPLAVRATKRLAHLAVLRGFDEGASRLMPDLRPVMETEDAGEGVLSFIERRRANFKGR